MAKSKPSEFADDLYVPLSADSKSVAMPDACVRSITFTIPGSSGGPGTQVRVVEVAGNLVFTVDVLNSATSTADLRGLFFHIDEAQLAGLRITDLDPIITQTRIGLNNVIDLGHGVSMKGAVKTGFDIGIEFGSPGIGHGDDISGPVSFTLDAVNDLSLDALTHMQFGARLTSVGAPDGARGGSSKDLFIGPAAPDANADSFNIFEDGAGSLNAPSHTPIPARFMILANDTDSDGDALIVTDFNDLPDHGTVAIAADGMTVLYTPDLDYAGLDSFVYCISDGNGGTDFATVNVAVEAVADVPDLVYTISAGEHVNEILLRVTATQTDFDSSEFIDRLALSGIPEGVTVVPGAVNPGSEPDHLVQDFLLTLPLNQDWDFDLGVTAVLKEVSNGDEETNTVMVPIVLDYNENNYTPTFLATDQSIWGGGNAFTFVDDTFLGIDTGFSKASGGLIGYDVGAHVKAGFQSTLTFTAGEIDANLNYDLGIDTHYNETTDSLLISSSQFLKGGDFTTVGPEGSYKLDFIFNYDFHLALTYDIDIFSGNILSVGGADNLTVNIVDLDSSDLATTITAPEPFDSVSIDLAWPHITTDANPTPPPAGEFTGSGASNNILQVNLDVDKALADIFLKGVNPFDVGFDILDHSVFGNFELADLDVFGGLNILQTFAMQAQGFTGTLHFENGVDQAFTFGSDILLQNASGIDAGGDNDGNVEFTLSLDAQATLNNNTDLGLNIGYSFDLLKGSFGYDFGLGIDDTFSFGPVFHAGGTLPVADLNVYDNTFALNFAPQDLGFYV